MKQYPFFTLFFSILFSPIFGQETDEEIIFETQMMITECPVEIPSRIQGQGIPPAPPPPPPPPPPREEDLFCFRYPDIMPLFSGCEEIENYAERKKCSDKNLLTYIESNLEYPCFAQEHGVKGVVVVQFTIEKNGRVANVKVVRDIGAGCGDAALQMVENMPDWEPGKQYGKIVPVLYTLPVRFNR